MPTAEGRAWTGALDVPDGVLAGALAVGDFLQPKQSKHKRTSVRIDNCRKIISALLSAREESGFQMENGLRSKTGVRGGKIDRNHYLTVVFKQAPVTIDS